jgi:hypothetical protein
MKYVYIAICLFLQIFDALSCSKQHFYLTKNYRGAICCYPNPNILYNCCCFDENLKEIKINFPIGRPPMVFKDTTGLNCDECELGVIC